MTGQLSREELAARLAGLRATLVLLWMEVHGTEPHPNLLKKNHEDTQAALDLLRDVRGYREGDRST